MITQKVFEYLALKAGTEIELKNFFEKFLGKLAEKNKKKDKFRPEKTYKIKEEILQILKGLEEEKLVEIKKKTLSITKPFKLSGRMSLSKRGDGFVRLNSGNEVFVPAEYTYGALEGDTVSLAILGVGKKGRLEAEVKEVIKRGRVLYRMRVTEVDGAYIYGRLLDMNGEEKEGVIRKKTLLQDVVNSIKLSEILIVKLKESNSEDRNLFEVSFVKFETGATRDMDLNRVLMKYNFSREYPDEIPLSFPEEVQEKTISDYSMRVDLRDLWTCTIDGKDSKDFDDAVSIEEEGDVLRFYVHIADVSYYVKQGSALDDEAYNRSTSVYLVDTVVPMLPPILSENLCSLVEGKNRLAFTVEMTGDYTGRIFSARFYKSIIKVDKRYTYDLAEEEILSNSKNSKIVKLDRLTKAMKELRIKSGRIDLNIKELYIQTEETGEVKEVKVRERLTSHMLIEELMLSANMKVAEYIYKNKAPVLYRIHESMDIEKLETLNSFLKLYGFTMNLKTIEYGELQEVLKKVQGNKSEKIFNYFLLRSFMQARYGGEHIGHWGLGFKDYCHFTSPIRRYPDLVVHRVLDAIIKDETFPYTETEIEVMGFKTSEEERRAADAERDLHKLKACRYLEKSGKKNFLGVIIGIKPQMIFVELVDFFGDASITHTHFTNEFELNIPNEFSFISKKYSKTFFIGEEIPLELEKIDYDAIKIFMKPVL
ncbi:MAG: ribonuclease R [Leptospiraceae bacterium]|nr:ribonuclease R [Leptospiraceae bacterium]